MVKKNKKKNADKKKKIEGESSAAAEKAVSSERNSNPPSEPETPEKLGGDERTPEQKKEMERLQEAESWMQQKDKTKHSALVFLTRLTPADVDPASDQVVLKLCQRRIKDALSLNEKIRNTYVSILVRDPEKREYRLRFSRSGDSYILYHEWAKVVADNGLKEGFEVYGNGIYAQRQFRMVISFRKEDCNDPSVSRVPDKDKKDVDATMRFMFEKKMDRGDLKEQLAIVCCSQRLKMLMHPRTQPYMKVLTSDSQGNVHELRLSRSVQQETYVLGNGWERIVSDNKLKEGDTVTGIGTIGYHGSSAVLHFNKKHETMEEALVLNQRRAFFFEKELEFPDINTLLDQLEIESCKDVLREIVAKAEEVEGWGGYVRVSATVEEGVTYELRLSRDVSKGSYVLYHQWRDVVTANRLMCGDVVTGWGNLAEDGSIKMNIDILKAIENV